MTWLSFLFDVPLIVIVSCNVAIFYHIVSVYKWTKWSVHVAHFFVTAGYSQFANAARSAGSISAVTTMQHMIRFES
jgi:hypothetical protein